MESTSNNSTAPKPLLRRGLGRLPFWLTSKYFIATTAFMAIMLFLGRNDLFTQLSRYKELKSQEKSKAHYTRLIDAERKELEGLEKNPASFEKTAREKYFMKKDGEEIFIISEKSDPAKN
jgi:cell division protein DivIC